MPGGALAGVGPIIGAPEPLWALLRDGVLVSAVAEPAAVLLRLGDGHDWRSVGGRVRTALQAALAEPAGWAFADSSGDDGILEAAARAVLDGEAGDYVRSHGGIVEFAGAHDGVLTLRIGGACASCPALGFTLQARVERAVRRLYPHLKSLVHKPLKAA